MDEDFETLFGQVRSLLHGAKTEKAWSELLSRLGWQFYDDDSEVTAEEERRREQVVAELLPYVAGELDAHWPDELRVITPGRAVELHPLAKILDLWLWEGPMQALCKSAGLPFADKKVSLKMVKALLPYVLRVEGHQFEGVILRAMSSHHELIVETLLRGNFETLRFLRFIQLFEPGKAKKGVEPDDRIRAVVDTVLDAHASTLEFIGVEKVRDHQARLVWERVMARADELNELRWLSFNEPDTFDEADVFKELIVHPGFDAVDTLTFPGGLSPSRARVLVERDASVSLRRIGSGMQRNMGLNVRNLIRAKRLAHVEIWDIRNGERPLGEWASREAAMWHGELTGEVRDELNRRVVDLFEFDFTYTRSCLFDEEKRLKPAPEMRALRVRHINIEDFCALIEQAPTVWPELECLVLAMSPYTRSDEENLEMVEWLNRSPLLEQLKFLDYSSEFTHPWRRSLTYDTRKTAKAAALRTSYFERILGDELHPFMAFRGWWSLRFHLHDKPSVVEFAKMLGIKGYSKKSRYDIADDITDVLIERLGGEAKLKFSRSRMSLKNGGAFKW